MQNDARPINAHRFAEHLKDWQQDIENDYYIEPYKRSIISDTLQTAIEDLDDQPTIDAVPVVHARWIPRGCDDYDAGMYFCSACKDERYFGDEVLTSEEAEVYAHYCPNCGAKMDGGAEE